MKRIRSYLEEYDDKTGDGTGMRRVVETRGVFRERLVGKRLCSAVLVLALVSGCLSGCGNGGSGSGREGLSGSDTEGQGAQQYAEGTAMGRYVEESLKLADGVRLSGNGNCLFSLDNGQIVITDSRNSFVISKDGGKGWYEDKRDWNQKMLERGDYILSAAVGGDNTVAVIYQPAEAPAENGSGDDTQAGTESGTGDDTPAGTESGSEDEPNAEAENSPEDETSPAGTENSPENDSPDTGGNSDTENDTLAESAPQLLIIRPDKTEIPVEIELSEEDDRMKGVYLSEDGRVFVTTYSSNIYEVAEDGTSGLFLRMEEGAPDLVQFQGDLMIADGWDYPSLIIYDMEQGEYIEDEALEDFIAENYADRAGFCGSWYDMFFFLDQDGVLYIAGDKGLYRHVIGGSAMEQIIDGNLSILGNPSYVLEGMIALEENEFLALLSGGKLIRFTYDQNIPSVPVVQLQVYSLKNNETVRQAINQYQTTNPEIYVDYEIGMGGDNSVTREDALKSLNTRIMAGDGPDLFVLDDMPVDSYIEKGILQDMSPLLESMSGENELFSNIVGAFRAEDKIYMLPCEIQLPAVLGRQSELAGITDLRETADAIEQMREAYPEKDLFRLYTHRGIMRLFSTVCAPVWMTEDNTVDRDMISEFLVQTKRIYDAQMDSLPDQVLDAYDDWNIFSQEEFGAPWDETDVMRSNISAIMIVEGTLQAGWGAVSGGYAYAECISLPRKEGYEAYVWAPLRGQCADAFTAKTLVGISTAAQQPEAAQDFVKGMFGKENQCALYQGLPVNKAALAACFIPVEEPLEEGVWGSLGGLNEDGSVYSLTTYWPDQAQITALQTYMESVKTPYLENTVLEEAVYTEGTSYMQGRKSLDEALDDIEKKMAIYLAE